jgi:hypothetical protein
MNTGGDVYSNSSYSNGDVYSKHSLYSLQSVLKLSAPKLEFLVLTITILKRSGKNFAVFFLSPNIIKLVCD